jgi:hypothetical protein
MESRLPLSEVPVEPDASSDIHITAFSAVKKQYGLQIKVSGCVTLRSAQSRSEKVIGIVELDDQIVPILDARKKPFTKITDLCCIVLFEHSVGQTTIVTGKLYESACQVFDLIVECMDHPEAHEHLYTHHKQTQPAGAEQHSLSQ